MLREADRRPPAALLRARPRSRRPRCSSPPAPPRRSPARCSACSTPATRSSSSSRCTTATGRASRWPARGPVPVLLRPDADGRYRFDPDELRAAITTGPELILLEHAAQPDRQGVRRRRAGRRSPPSPSSTTCIVVTDEVYEHLVFPGADHVPIATLPGDGRADADDLVGRQDVQHDRLEGRLDVRPGAAGRPRPGRPSSSSPTSTGRRSNRRSPSGSTSATTSTPTSPPTSRPSATAWSPGCAPPGSRPSCPRPRTSPPSTSARSSPTATAWRSAARCPQRCGVVAIPSEVFYARPEHGRHLVRFACCKRLEVLDEAAAAPGQARVADDGRAAGRRASSTTSCGTTATPTSTGSPR